MLKRRRLILNQKVRIIFDSKIGFVSKPAIFKKYTRTMVGKVSHEIPVFEYEGREITGLDCFWIPEEQASPEQVELIQRQLIPLQVKALETSYKLGYEIPEKIKDPEIRKMAKENIEKIDALVKKFGFDPRDDS
ncbi:hypothetical protein LCGC14_1101850, partial [marine sediment metagenome]